MVERMKKYFAVSKDKIGVNISKKIFFNGSQLVINIEHGFGYVKTDMPLSDAQAVVRGLGITLYKSKKDFDKKVKKTLEERTKNV